MEVGRRDYNGAANPLGMVVKSKRGRRRYIVFTIPCDVGRNDVLAALEPISGSVPEHKVITSFGGKAVVRCEPGNEKRVAEAMSSAWKGSVSLTTSGTLRTVREKYPELKVPQKRKR